MLDGEKADKPDSQPQASLFRTVIGSCGGFLETATFFLRPGNEVRVYGDPSLVREAEELLKTLDTPEENSIGPVTDSPSSTSARNRNQPATQSSDTTDGSAELLKRSVAELRQRVEDVDQQSRDLADKLKRPLKDPAEAKPLKALLRDVVQKAFVTRQELRRAELDLFAIRLQGLKQSLELRDRIADKIVDRRVEELLDPNLSWESPDDSAPPADVPNANRSQSVMAFLRANKSERDEDIQWLVTRLADIGIGSVTVGRGGKPNILDILCRQELPPQERARLEREINALLKDAQANGSCTSPRQQLHLRRPRAQPSTLM